MPGLQSLVHPGEVRAERNIMTGTGLVFAVAGFIAVIAGFIIGAATGNWGTLGSGFAGLVLGLFLIACRVEAGPPQYHGRRYICRICQYYNCQCGRLQSSGVPVRMNICPVYLVAHPDDFPSPARILVFQGDPGACPDVCVINQAGPFRGSAAQSHLDEKLRFHPGSSP